VLSQLIPPIRPMIFMNASVTRICLALHIYAQLSCLFKIADPMRQDVPFNIILSDGRLAR